jgi:hypothetical protein
VQQQHDDWTEQIDGQSVSLNQPEHVYNTYIYPALIETMGIMWHLSCRLPRDFRAAISSTKDEAGTIRITSMSTISFGIEFI